MADWTGHLDRPLGHCESSFRTAADMIWNRSTQE